MLPEFLFLKLLLLSCTIASRAALEPGLLGSVKKVSIWR